MIAMALLCRPKLLIADEPTTSLDVTIQTQIPELIKELKKKFSSSVLLITHNLAVVVELSDRLTIIYAGKIMESSDVVSVFKKSHSILTHVHCWSPYRELISIRRLSKVFREMCLVLSIRPLAVDSNQDEITLQNSVLSKNLY